MSAFDEWQKNKIVLAAAKNWQANRNKIDSQSGFLYSVRASLKTTSIEYFGKSCGLNDYHTCSDQFVRYLNGAVEKMHKEIIDCAIKMLEDEVRQMANASKQEVIKLAAECGLSVSENEQVASNVNNGETK